MKYYLVLIVILLLMLNSSCSELIAVSEKQTEDNAIIDELEEKNFLDDYTFPPNEEEFIAALKESGMNNWHTADWRIDEKPTPLVDVYPSFPISIHTISNTSDSVISSLNFKQSIDKSCAISFGYKKEVVEQYERFQQEEWPLYWTLAGKLFLSSDEITNLGEQCVSYFNNYVKNGQGNLVWCGRIDDIHCTVQFGWDRLLKQYVPLLINIDNSESFNAEMYYEVKYNKC